MGCGQGTYAIYLNKYFTMDGLDIYSPHDNEAHVNYIEKVIIRDIRILNMIIMM